MEPGPPCSPSRGTATALPAAAQGAASRLGASRPGARLLTGAHVRFSGPGGTGLRTLPPGTPAQVVWALTREAPASLVRGAPRARQSQPASPLPAVTAGTPQAGGGRSPPVRRSRSGVGGA